MKVNFSRNVHDQKKNSYLAAALLQEVFFFFFYKKTKSYDICCPFASSKKASLSEIRLNFLLVKRHQLILACVADALNLLYINGLDECVGRLQRRLTNPRILTIKVRSLNCAVRCEKQQKTGKL